MTQYDSKPHVALVRGPIISTNTALNNEATPSLAFAYLSSYAEAAGYPCTIVDGVVEGLNQVWPLEDFPGYQIQGLPLADIVGLIPETAAVVGVSAMFSGDWPAVRRLIKLIRAKRAACLIVAGGEHVTALPEYVLRDCPELDICVRGEGERTLVEILHHVAQNLEPVDIEGTSYLDKSGQYVEVGGLTRIRDLETIPWPKWPEGYLEKFWAAGKSYGVQSERDMPIMASRGCPYQCTFCSNPSMWTTRYVLRDVDDVVAEIKNRIEKYDITGLQFYDLTAITKKSWTINYCKRLIAEGINIPWSLPSGTRSEALDDETLTLLKRTGCNYLVYAPESGSPETLTKIKKKIDLDKLTESAVTAVKLGIVVRTNLIIGFPHETRRNIWETVAYGLKLAAKGIDEVSIYIFSPYPGTKIFRELTVAGKLAVNDDYFMSLTSLNGDYFRLNPICVNDNVGRLELALYRLVFMIINYLVGYILFPRRIVRSLKNIFGESHAATVLEHRLKDVIRRRRVARASQ